MTLYEFIALDLPPLITVTAAALSCALLGNFLVLQRVSLIGDALSHAVLPGIVVAFLLSGSRSTWIVFFGAIGAGVLCTVLIEAVKRLGNVEASAAMGVVFSIFFAVGVLLMEIAAARVVDLDADCLLHGQLETIFWYPPDPLLSLKALLNFPGEAKMALLVLLAVVIFVGLFWKELILTSFDPPFSRALGFHTGAITLVLMAILACAVVASFAAVGSILVIAMIICPAATMRFYTDTLSTQVLGSLVCALLCCVVGYFSASLLPPLLGASNAVSASGSIVTTMGVALGATILCAPRYGILGRSLRTHRLSRTIAEEDLLAFLYRREEVAAGATTPAHLAKADAILAAHTTSSPAAVRSLTRKGLIHTTQSDATSSYPHSLTPAGRTKATRLIRSHRLWESYFVDKVGIRPDHVHGAAETLEHVTDELLVQRLEETQRHPTTDPHGKEIPTTEGSKDK